MDHKSLTLFISLSLSLSPSLVYIFFFSQALCKYKDQVDVYTMDAPLSVGPVFARHLGYRLYRGEYYATQSDAHVSFTQNWDTDIIHQLEATHNDMAVLSTYLTDIVDSIDPVTGKSLVSNKCCTFTYMCTHTIYISFLKCYISIYLLITF